MSFFKYLKEFFLGIYDYREYLRQSVQRDLRRRYRRTFLGYIWSMLQPLLMMIILTAAFAKIMNRSSDDYAVFLFAGMIPYSYFRMTITASLGSVRGSAQITEQIPVPRFVFPLSFGISNLIDLIFSLIPLLLVMFVVGHAITWQILLFPLVMIPLFCATMGLSYLFAASNVFFEDTEHLSGVLLQALYFLSPILYGREQLPEWLIKYVLFNPMFLIVEFSRDTLYNGKMPDLTWFGLSCAGSVGLLALGLYVFNRADKKFMYFI